MAEEKQPQVYIACRATPDCPGRQAIILFTHRTPTTLQGIQLAEEGGRFIRYRCLTCGRDFHIQQ